MEARDRLYEGTEEEIALYDYSGDRVGSTRPYVGPIFLAPDVHRLFACEVSFHYGTTHAYLVDETGAVLAAIEHLGEPYKCFTTEDQRFVLIIHMLPGRSRSAWRVGARVFDFDGKMVAHFESDKETRELFEAGGRRYEVPLPQPGQGP